MLTHTLNVNFYAWFQNHGKLYITADAATVPIDLVVEAWADFKKYQLHCKDRSKRGLGVTATFTKLNNSIRCSFWCNSAYPEKGRQEIHKIKYENSYEFWILDFQDILRQILIDYNNGASKKEILARHYTPSKEAQEAKILLRASKKLKKRNSAKLQKT